MDMIQIVLLGIIATILFILLKDVNVTFAFIILILTSIIMLLFILQRIGFIIDLLNVLGERASIDGVYLKTILQIIGIAYITELGANITKDAGLTSVASKIELAGKILILILAIPIITAVIEAILHFLPSI